MTQKKLWLLVADGGNFLSGSTSGTSCHSVTLQYCPGACYTDPEGWELNPGDCCRLCTSCNFPMREYRSFHLSTLNMLLWFPYISHHVNTFTSMSSFGCLLVLCPDLGKCKKLKLFLYLVNLRYSSTSLNLSTRCRWVVSFTSWPLCLPLGKEPWYSFCSGLSGPQSHSRCSGEEKIFSPYQE
jgi:hypothetical protein